MHLGFAAQSPNSTYWLIVSQGVQRRAAELGHSVTTLHADTLDQQIDAIHTLLAQRVDALLLGPVATHGLSSAIAEAHAARVPVVVLAASVGDAMADCTVQSDHRRGAELAAAHVVEQIGGSGEVAHLIGPRRLQDNIDRSLGVQHIFQQHPGVSLVYERESPDWRPETGRALMAEALARHPDLRGVCVANDTIAMGALEAIEERGLTGKLVVTGFDASPEALIAIHEGRMSASVRQAVADNGRVGVEMAARLASGNTAPRLVLTPISLVTRDTLLEALLESVYLLPNALRDAVERGEALAHAQQQLIQTQQAALRELSTPVVPIRKGVLLMPLIGSIDPARAQQITEALLGSVHSLAARIVILDLTGVPLVDTQIANSLIRVAQAVSLLGAEVVVTGIRSEMAQTLVGLGVELRGIITRATVADGILYAMRG